MVRTGMGSKWARGRGDKREERAGDRQASLRTHETGTVYRRMTGIKMVLSAEGMISFHEEPGEWAERGDAQ